MWDLIFAGVSAAAGTFSAVDGYYSNRAIREKLDKITNYLNEIDAKIDQLIFQNKIILDKLDELPRLIRVIVQEIVDFALLDERYATIHSIKLDIITLKLDRKYRITEPGWSELSETLSYLFLFENRISYLFKLILACELALAATRSQAQPFIIRLLKDKIGLLHDLLDSYQFRIMTELNTLKTMLDQPQFILSHNLKEDLADFANFSYVKQQDRQRTVSYSERVCHLRTDHCGNEWEVCHDEPRTRQEPDTPFHSDRDAHVTLIEQKRVMIGDMLIQLRNLLSVVKQFDNYLTLISRDKLKSDNVMLFHPRIGNKLHAADENHVMLSVEEQTVYFEYLDDISAHQDDITAKIVIANAPEISGRFEEVLRICPPI